MTSSLVGSEMCIRDRVMGEYTGGSAKLRVKLWGGLAKLWVQLWVKGAVSYTHLTLPTICSV
eukprot:5533977-Prorocentrum_lima.AAC.1